jgi:hypothetical protein
MIAAYVLDDGLAISFEGMMMSKSKDDEGIGGKLRVKKSWAKGVPKLLLQNCHIYRLFSHMSNSDCLRVICRYNHVGCSQGTSIYYILYLSSYFVWQ